MSKNLTAKYYQKNKDYKEKLVEDTKILLKKKRKKSDNMVLKATKISQKMKKINWLSIEKNIIE